MSWCCERGVPHSQLLGWDPEDRAKLHAFLLEAGERCPSCGTAPWEWAEDRQAYVPVTQVCLGCYMRSVGAEDEHQMPGTTVRLIPRRMAEEDLVKLGG